MAYLEFKDPLLLLLLAPWAAMLAWYLFRQLYNREAAVAISSERVVRVRGSIRAGTYRFLPALRFASSRKRRASSTSAAATTRPSTTPSPYSCAASCAVAASRRTATADSAVWPAVRNVSGPACNGCVTRTASTAA